MNLYNCECGERLDIDDGKQCRACKTGKIQTGEEKTMKNLKEVCKEYATQNRINYSDDGLSRLADIVSEWIKQHIPFETRPESPEAALETLIRYRLVDVEKERDELKKENDEISDLKYRIERQVQANQDLVDVNCSLLKERDEARQKVADYSAAMTDWRSETGKQSAAKEEELAAQRSQVKSLTEKLLRAESELYTTREQLKGYIEEVFTLEKAALNLLKQLERRSMRGPL